MLFILTVLLITFIAIAFAFDGSPAKAYKYFTTERGKGVGIGIILFVGIGLGAVLMSPNARALDLKEDLEYFQYGEVYLGLDSTFKQSPQCQDDGPDNRLTSNGGVIFNIARSKDRIFELNTKYTHHSCAFNSDRNGYDAVGLVATWKLWGN
jgi:hypothetical protein